MFCSKCGTEIADACAVCPKCGAKVASEKIGEEMGNAEENTNDIKSGKKKKMKKIIIISGIVFLLVVALIIGGKLYQNNRYINNVKNGCLGSYYTVSIEEIFPGFEWTVERKVIDNKEQNVVYAEKNDGYVIFTSSDKFKNFKISDIDFGGEVFDTSENIAAVMDQVYYEYSCKYPDKGILVSEDKLSTFALIMSTSNTYKETSEKKQEISNEYFHDIDIEDYYDKLYYQETMDAFQLKQEDYEDDSDYVFSDEKGILTIGIRDKDGEKEGIFGEVAYSEESTADILVTIKGSRNISPSLQEIRLGDNIDDVKKELESEKKFTFVSEEEEENSIVDAKRVVFRDANGFNYRFIYHTDTNAIFEMQYLAHINVYEMQNHGYQFTGDKKLQLATEDFVINVQEDNGEDAKGNTNSSQNINQQEFIGNAGVYIFTGDTGYYDLPGRIEISNITDSTMDFKLGSLGGIEDWASDTMQIIGNNQAQIEYFDFTLVFTWTDSDNIIVSRVAGSTYDEYMDYMTDSQPYLRSPEFN